MGVGLGVGAGVGATSTAVSAGTSTGGIGGNSDPYATSGSRGKGATLVVDLFVGVQATRSVQESSEKTRMRFIIKDRKEILDFAARDNSKLPPLFTPLLYESLSTQPVQAVGGPRMKAGSLPQAHPVSTLLVNMEIERHPFFT